MYCLYPKTFVVSARKDLKLCLSEANYPVYAFLGYTVFWQIANAPQECRGVLNIKRGLNYIPWVDLEFPVPVPVNCLQNAIRKQYFGGCSMMEDAVRKMKDNIVAARNERGFHLTPPEIYSIKNQVCHYQFT